MSSDEPVWSQDKNIQLIKTYREKPVQWNP